MAVLIAVARADMIAVTAWRVLKCLLIGALAVRIGLRLIYGRDKP